MLKCEDILDKALNYLLLYKDDDDDDFSKDYDDKDNVNEYGGDVINLDKDENDKQEPLCKKTKLDSNESDDIPGKIGGSQNNTNNQEMNTANPFSKDSSEKKI